MMPPLIVLLLAVCGGLFALAVGAMLLLRHRQRQQRYVARVDGVMLPHRRSALDAAAKGLSLSRELKTATMFAKAARLLRYDRANPGLYPLRPPVVISLALIPSAAAGYVAVGFIGSFGWLALPLMCVWLGRTYYGYFEDRLSAALFRQFPDTLATIVRAVRVGLPIVEAIRIVSRESPQPTRQEFAVLVAQTAIGVPLDDALREMAERNRLTEYRFFATALSLQSQTGGGLTETLDNLADTVRKRAAARLRGHALAAEARMSSYVLGALPLIAGGLLSVANPEYMAILFNDQGGRKLLLVALVLLMSGGMIMRVMIRRSLT